MYKAADGCGIGMWTKSGKDRAARESHYPMDEVVKIVGLIGVGECSVFYGMRCHDQVW